MKQTILLFTIVSVILVNDTGCATAGLMNQDATSATEKSNEPSVTLHRMFWGLLWNGDYIAPNSQGKGFYEVHVKTTFWEGLVTVVTLGIYCPVDIEWAFAVKGR